MSKHIPETTKEVFDGIQKVYRFANGYGASVVRHQYSYGAEDGLWEVAVIQHSKRQPHEWEIVYDSPITSDVIGYVTDEEVEEIMDRISAMTEEDIQRHQEAQEDADDFWPI